MKGRIIVSTLLALLLFVSLPMSALAATWDIGKGDITVNAESGGQTVRQGGGAAIPDSAPVITGTSKENNVTINADSGQTASVTLSGVNIDVRDKGKAAVSTTGEGNVSIELNGGSTLRSGYEHAGLEKNNGGSLTIADEDKNGKLTAWGGQQGAGIGGGSGKDGSNIFITGGVVSGLGAAIALKSGASTGGTDFIALWVSNHTGKTIWGVIFGFNCFILAIFGFMFGWDKAAYSIVFQFISTKTIDSFYRRYDRVTLQITTRKADEVMTAYVDHFQHGISCAEVIGGYSREMMYLLNAVVSTYESQDIIKLVCDIDTGAEINVFHTLNFVGGWWGGHVDEPMPTAVPDPDKPARMASRQARLSEQDSLQQDDGK